jgi:hypothetical protein
MSWQKSSRYEKSGSGSSIEEKIKFHFQVELTEQFSGQSCVI